MKSIYKNKKTSLSCFIAITAIVAGSVYTFSFLKDHHNTEQIAPVYHDKITGLLKDETINIEYRTPTTVMNKSVVIQDNAPLSMNEPSIQNTVNNEAQYGVHYTRTQDQKSYTDISLKVQKIKNNVRTTILGAENGTRASLKIAGQNYYRNIPVDWAGRIVLDVNNTTNLTDKNICITLKNEKSLEICHHVPSGQESKVAL